MKLRPPTMNNGSKNLTKLVKVRTLISLLVDIFVKGACTDCKDITTPIFFFSFFFLFPKMHFFLIYIYIYRLGPPKISKTSNYMVIRFQENHIYRKSLSRTT
jgi:hypothetical protein